MSFIFHLELSLSGKSIKSLRTQIFSLLTSLIFIIFLKPYCEVSINNLSDILLNGVSDYTYLHVSHDFFPSFSSRVPCVMSVFWDLTEVNLIFLWPCVVLSIYWRRDKLLFCAYVTSLFQHLFFSEKDTFLIFYFILKLTYFWWLLTD